MTLNICYYLFTRELKFNSGSDIRFLKALFYLSQTINTTH